MSTAYPKVIFKCDCMAVLVREKVHGATLIMDCMGHALNLKDTGMKGFHRCMMQIKML